MQPYKKRANPSSQTPFFRSSLLIRFSLVAAVVSLVLSPFMSSIAANSSRLFSSSFKLAVPRALSAFSSPARLFSSSPLRLAAQNPPPIMSSATTNSFLETVKARRTFYALKKELAGVSKDRVQEIVKEAVLAVPSSFNSQSNRVAVLFDGEHDKFWGLVEETLKAIVPAENWSATEQRVNMFKGGAGTILFFEDQTVVEGMQAKFAIYADKFPIWAMQSDAMLQFVLWTALEAEGLGANLQHYNPIVDEKVAATWKFPANWKLNAQLVFGAKAGDAGEKTQIPIEERVRVFGA